MEETEKLQQPASKGVGDEAGRRPSGASPIGRREGRRPFRRRDPSTGAEEFVVPSDPSLICPWELQLTSLLVLMFGWRIQL